MTCREAIDVIADFLDQVLSSEACGELERHLGDCEPCRAYLNTYRQTRALTGRAGQVQMPPEMRQRLRQFLIDQLGR
jgi:anti-sigma factor (TIGR02949 family)